MNDKFDELAKNFAKSVVRRTERPFLLPVLVGFLDSVMAGQVSAQTFRTVYSFNSWPEGRSPECTLALSSNTLFGTTSSGGTNGTGTVFAVDTDGTRFTTLYSFDAVDIRNANSEGAYPAGDLALAGNILYGTATSGGLCPPCGSGQGTVFKVNTDGSGFGALHIFAGGNSDGAGPGGLRISGNTLFGATGGGGESNNGTVFSLNTDRTGFAILYSFGPIGTNSYGWFTNSHQWFTNSGGTLLYVGLILSGDRFYGTSAQGGSFGNGTVFGLNTDGTGLMVLHTFPAPAQTNTAIDVPPLTNSGGAFPSSSLLLLGNTLYGTTYEGGRSGMGTIFKVNTDGTGFMTLHEFTATIPYYDSFGNIFLTNSDGAYPVAGLIVSGNTLYGTASAGGSSGNGTIFSIPFTPQLSITPSGSNVILSWPTNYAGFDYSGYALQSNTNLGSGVWTTNLPTPFVVNGQNTVTNLISGTQQFFRLSQ